MWVKQLQPTVFVPVVASSATAPPSASSAAPPTFDEDEPKWAPVVAEGQKLYESGQRDAAQKKFAEAAAMPGGAAIGKLFQDQTTIAPSGPCRLVAFSHPRLQSSVSSGRPSVLATPKGAVVAWTDSNDTQPKRDHVKSVLIDSAGRPLSKPRDITPEAGFVYRPHLVKNEDKVGVLYWDATGKDSVGVRIRKLDEEGRIDGARHIPLELLSAEADSLPTDRPIVFQCRAGVRSLMAAQAFKRAGFDAWSLHGGLEAWVAAGLPLTPDGGTVADHQ